MEAGNQPGTPITVVVADRHHFLRQALARLVSREPGFALAGHAQDAGTARRVLGHHRPHALLLEPAILGGLGLAGIGDLLRLSPATSVVVLADEPSPALERHAAGHGAVATILKHAPPDELFHVVRHAVATPRSSGRGDGPPDLRRRCA